jgi:proteasome assembly chaperone (PAC2) family protein
MEKETWIERRSDIKLIEPTAVVGSPGLRSIGKLVMESLIAKTQAALIADLYSTHMPSIYQTKPSYASHPMLPGTGGVIVESGEACSTPSLIITKGYHANFEGQYEVAGKVLNFLAENHVKRIIVVAGFGSKDKKVCGAATSKELVAEMKEKYGIDIGYTGPFMGFSGLVFGLSKRMGMEALCLFAGTELKGEDSEFPDKEASDRALDKLSKILGFHE